MERLREPSAAGTFGIRGLFGVFPPLGVWWRLVRPTILLAVLVSMAVAAMAAPEATGWLRLTHSLLGTALVIAGATAANQMFERRSDGAMDRTASRPVPAGLATPQQVGAFAAACSLAGLACLAALEPPAVALWAAASWTVYVLVYTPLKRRSVWHIPAGAVAGAMPVLLGGATAGAVAAPTTWTLASVVFFWQFSHTAALGWLYREQYARGGIKVGAVVDPTGRLSGRMAVGGDAALMLASLIPAAWCAAAWPYVAVALPFGLAHLVVSAKFLYRPSDAHAWTLSRLSMLHLPALLLAWLMWCRATA